MGDMEKCCDFSVLHMDLKEEILAWLPIESVCRFRSVSKEWNGILSREFITNKWVKKAPNKDPWLVPVREGRSHKWEENGWVPVGSLASCFFDQTWKETSAVSLSFLQQYPEPEPESRDPHFSTCYGSAAGLFLLCRIRGRGMDPQMQFVVFNPLTRTSVELLVPVKVIFVGL